MPSYNIQDGNSGFKRFKTVGEGTEENPYVPVVGINVVPDVDSTTGWTSPLSDTNVVSEKLIKETIDGQEITGASYDSNTGDLTLTKTDGNIIVNIPLSSSNTYITSASFNTSDGVLTLTLNDSSTVTVDLDGRYLENIIEDITPQLGGNLDLNSNDITGTGDISITGEVEATTLIGNMQGATIFKAKAGEALTKGDPVYISGDDLTGNQPVVSIADSDDANKMPCFGLAAETVSLNSNVNVVTFGTLSGLNTSSFNQGDILYISTTGTLTATKPSGESSLIQNIGKVMRSHASAGSIKVGGAGRTNDVPNLNDGNVFIGNASNQTETRGLTLDDIAQTVTNKHFTASDETKLDGIETGATADQTASEIKTAYESNSDTNAFTDAEKTKLSGIAAGAEVNVNADWNATSGDAQILNKPSDITDLTGHNVAELADITSAGSGSIITASERTKLNGIESNATADQTKADIDALGINADQLDGVEASGFIRSNADDSYTGTITAIADGANPVLKIQGTGPNFMTFASDNTGTVDGTSIDLAYRTSPNTLGFERSSDKTSLFSVDADDGLAIFANNINVGGNITVSGNVDGRDIATDGTKLDTIETNATADQTKSDIDALNINADQVDGLEASQFFRSDVGDSLNVGRGDVYFENNTNDNQDGAGFTIRTSNNPGSGGEGSVGSIFAIRSSGGATRFWVGQSTVTTGGNNFQTYSGTFRGNITLIANNGYYITNNANVFHGINSTSVTPTATDTSYYAIFDSNPVTNSAIYSYTAPTSSSNTGIRLLKSGKYKVSYTLNWQNTGTASRANFFSLLVKHSSAITPTETELAGSRSFGYLRNNTNATIATTTNVTVIDVDANEYIKCKTTVAKNDTTFDDNFSDLVYHINSSIVIEFLGDI